MRWPSPASWAGMEKCWPPTSIPAGVTPSPTARHGRKSTCVSIAGATDATNLPDGCCDAIYMRTMLHHVANPPAFARDVVRSIRPGGRIAVIDFAPGRLWFHGGDHGVTPEDITAAFTSAGCTLRHRDDHWGGPTFLLLFECVNRRIAILPYSEGAAARRTAESSRAVSGLPTVALAPIVTRERRLVDGTRLELVTSALRTRRSPN